MRRGVVGTSAHKKIMKLIIETNLNADQSHMEHACTAMHSQRLQTLDADFGRKRSREERQERRTRLSEARDPANRPSQKSGREHAACVIHDDRVDGAQEESDEGDGDGAADEGGHEPDDEFESVDIFVSKLAKDGRNGQVTR